MNRKLDLEGHMRHEKTGKGVCMNKGVKEGISLASEGYREYSMTEMVCV